MASHRPATSMMQTAGSKIKSLSVQDRNETVYILSFPTPTGFMMQHIVNIHVSDSGASRDDTLLFSTVLCMVRCVMFALVCSQGFTWLQSTSTISSASSNTSRSFEDSCAHPP